MPPSGVNVNAAGVQPGPLHRRTRSRPTARAGPAGGHAASSTVAAAVVLAAWPPNDPAGAAGRDRVLRCKGPGCTPAAFTFTPDGSTIFYAERLSGEIRRRVLGTKKDRRFAKIPDVSRRGEQGVLGIALDPDWDQGRKHQWVYVYYTEGNPHRTERSPIVRRRNTARGVALQIHTTMGDDER